MNRIPVSSDVEHKILIGLIVDDSYCGKSLPLLDPNYFEGSFTKIVLGWIQEYYESFKHAPGKDIQSVYISKKEELKQEERDLVAEFLSNLSKRFESEVHQNWHLWHDETVRFCERKQLETLRDKLESFLKLGQVERAREAVTESHPVLKQTGSWSDILEDSSLLKDAISDKESGILRLPGQLGKMIGPLDREQLIAIFGPAKRGKTWWLMYFGLIALTQHLNVVKFSLEMNKIKMTRRIIQAITNLRPFKGTYHRPVFDCESNQKNSCDLPYRTNHLPLFKEGTFIKPPFDPESKYRPCTYCKDHPEYDENFVVGSWFESYTQEKNLDAAAIRSMKSSKLATGGATMKLICYPRFGAGIRDIERDLRELEVLENFTPDVVIVDYADILSPEGLRNTEGRDKYDEIWKNLGKIASERKVVMITASQSNRESFSSYRTEAEHTAEDIRKLAHCDMAIGLSQLRTASNNEKIAGRMRLSVIVRRFGEDYEEDAVVLQNLAAGQVHLESYVKSINRRG